MLPNLKNIFKNKLVEEVDIYSSDYYYFYKDLKSKKLFGVLKNITSNEYALLKEMYVEKTIYNLDKTLQQVYEYLLEDGNYPFKNNKVKLIIYNVKKEDSEIVSTLLKDIYPASHCLELYNLYVCFIEGETDNIKDLFETISIDLGYDINLHDGLICNNSFSGSTLLTYIKVYHDSVKVYSMLYSDIADTILGLDVGCYKDLLINLKDNLLYSLFKDVQVRDIITVMLKNDLNVSQSAKLLYMNRNSLINKLDYIYKETGLNIQKFTHACVVYLMLNLV